MIANSTPRIAARDLLTEPQLANLRERSLWRGIWMIAHAWGVILGAIALAAWWPNPLTFLLAVLLIGSRQLGLAILMHEGAHGCFSTNQKLTSVMSNPFNDGFGSSFMGDYTGNAWDGATLFASWMDSRTGSFMQDEVGGFARKNP